MSAMNVIGGVEKDWDVDEEGQLGFTDQTSGVRITDPRLSSCGRFAVEPSTYGMDEDEVRNMIELNGLIEIVE